MATVWCCLEEIRGLAAVSAEWRRFVGNEFGAFKAAFLEKSSAFAKSYPCRDECGCAHEVVRHRDGRIVAVCRCEPWNCDDILLSEDDLCIYRLSWTKLGRALARAFDCDAKVVKLAMPDTLQVASLGGTLPIILTIQQEAEDLRSALGQVVAIHREGFVVLSPTNRFFDARCHGLLANARAGFFDLESNLTLLANGMVAARKSGGELFSRYLQDAPEPAGEDVLRRMFALVQKLDATESVKDPTVLRVFSLYCGKLMTAEQVAQKCGCAKGTVINRLRLLERVAGMKPDKLRAYSPMFNRVEDELSDSRARRIYRESEINVGDGEE